MQCRFCNYQSSNEFNFCSRCGEKLQPKRLTIKSIFSAFFAEFLNYDNKVTKTFRHMFTQPEAVINSYISGSRKSYVNVITYFSISLTLAALQVFIIKEFYYDLLVIVPTETDVTIPFDQNSFNLNLMDYQGLIAILLTPFSGIMSWLAFIDNKKYNIAEHIILNIYASAQFFIIWFFCTGFIIWTNTKFHIASIWSLVGLFIYMIYVFKRIFTVSYIVSFARTIIYFILFSIFYAAVFSLLGALIVLYLVKTGQLQL